MRVTVKVMVREEAVTTYNNGHGNIKRQNGGTLEIKFN